MYAAHDEAYLKLPYTISSIDMRNIDSFDVSNKLTDLQ